MPDAIRVIHASTPTATGTADYVSTGFGTPIAAIVLTGCTDSFDTQKGVLRSSIGFTDFTFDRCCGLTVTGDTIPTNTKRHANNKVVHTRAQSDGSNLHVANFDSTATDGITINWTSTDSTAYNLIVILIGSDAASDIYVNDFSPTVADTELDVTAPGFQADWIIAQWVDRSVPANGNGSTWAMGIAAYNGTSWDQWSFGVNANDNVDPSACDQAAQEDCLIAAIDSGGEVGEVIVTDTNANGFSVTPTGVGYSTDVIYMCGKNPAGRQCQVSGMTAPTATGTWTNTDFGFTGDNVILLGQRLTSYAYEGGTTSNNWRTNCSFADKAGNEASLWLKMRNNHATSPRARAMTSQNFVFGDNQNEVEEYHIDTVAFTSTGWTASVTTASPSTGPKWGALLFGEAPLSVSTYMGMTNVGQ